ncbi:MAG: DUF1232 domain-containing protein [Bacilli bacterium]|nr:DUF1232 domain-containing protein [Bacilli bacterium]
MKLKEKIIEIEKKTAALFLALKNPETPWYAKIFAGITIAYALSPVDLIPDFIPLLGYLDDLIILPLLLTLSIKLIPRSIYNACLIKADAIWKDGKPSKWYFAIPIILIWLIIIYFIVKHFI